jgi:hypothetical protein
MFGQKSKMKEVGREGLFFLYLCDCEKCEFKFQVFVMDKIGRTTISEDHSYLNNVYIELKSHT